MIGKAMYTTILTLFKQGKSRREISRLTGHDRKTVQKVIKKFEVHGIEAPPALLRLSKLNQYHDQIMEYLESDLSNVRIYEELQRNSAELGNDFKISYSALSRYIAKISLNKEICVRFHTPAGEEAQVDFGYVGKQPDADGKIRKAWAFNLRLSYSRLDYYEIVFDQKVATFINCHRNAFRFFGGIPKVVKIDNLKSAILEAGFYESVYQDLYKRFADHYGFYPLPCRVRKPQEKGKVESGIKYVKNNFFCGRNFTSFDDLKKQLSLWMLKANNRVHGTTKEKPLGLFLMQEKSRLLHLPEHEFKTGCIFIRKVAKDCHITLDNNYYSVPCQYALNEVDAETSESLVTIYSSGIQIAVHPRSKGKGHFITQSSHYPKFKNFTADSQEYLHKYRESMEQIGSDAANLFLLIVRNHPKEWYRTTKGILSLRKTYSKSVINLACKRAIHFSLTNYSKVKKICESGCYNLPLPEGNSARTEPRRIY